MEFVDGSRARVRGVTIMHGPCADRHVGGWVAARGVEAPRSRCTEISLIMHSFQAAVIILHIAGGGVPTAFANFSTRPKRNGRQFGRATHASLRARLPNDIRWNLTEFDHLLRLKKKYISLRGNRRHSLCKEDTRVYSGMRVYVRGVTMDLLNITVKNCLFFFFFSVTFIVTENVYVRIGF